ncbi:MAG: RNA-binding S4 domain-containing protein [Bacteroidia bacterium]|jgi:ribosome-associated protein
MNKIKFQITQDYIELIKLLKATGIAENGGEAKQLVREGKVFLNNDVEVQMRKKILKGDSVQIFDHLILVE